MSAKQCNGKMQDAQAGGAHQHPEANVFLEKMARICTGSGDLPHAFELMAEEIGTVVVHDGAAFFSYDTKRHTLVVEATAPAGALRFVRGSQVQADGAVSDLPHGGLAAAVCMDTSSSSCALEYDLSQLGLRSSITVPLRSANRFIGLLTLCRREHNGFWPHDTISLCRLQNPLAVAIEHVMKCAGTEPSA